MGFNLSKCTFVVSVWNNVSIQTLTEKQAPKRYETIARRTGSNHRRLCDVLYVQHDMPNGSQPIRPDTLEDGPERV